MSYKQDRTIEEACNEGSRDLMADYVGDTSGDMVTHFKKSPMHMSTYFYRNPPADSAFAVNFSHSRLRFAEITEVKKMGISEPVINNMPDECITMRIPGWQYHPELQGETEKRRVFRLADQGLKLDIEATLTYMSATEPVRAEKVRSLLEWENSDDNVPNQVVLQKMYQNIEAKLPMFEGIGFMPNRFRPRK